MMNAARYGGVLALTEAAFITFADPIGTSKRRGPYGAGSDASSQREWPAPPMYRRCGGRAHGASNPLGCTSPRVHLYHREARRRAWRPSFAKAGLGASRRLSNTVRT